MTETSSLTAPRWRKYGKDRLYVSDHTGERVGWADLLTRATTVEEPELATEFHEAPDLPR